ncbi:MAG TPA: hypothetical protein VFP16_06385 [Vicinamibacterales bacterium]|nr:hypothetical protein [Vicinamibacterales bacterium]
MAEKSLEERVNMLERGVEILEQLPDRVTALEVQIVELRGEMRAEFSATRAEVREGDERVIQTLRQEIHAGDEHVVQTLRQEIRAGDEETRRFMRILHEDLVERIEILGGTR